MMLVNHDKYAPPYQRTAHFLGQQINSQSCEACLRKEVCEIQKLSHDFTSFFDERALKKLVFHQDQEVFASDDQRDSLYVVRSGMFKSYTIDNEGNLQIIAFHLPGDFFGMEKVHSEHFFHYVKTLDTSSVCAIPLSTLGDLSVGNNKLAFSLLSLLRTVISKNHELIFSLSKMDAKRRFSSFLLDLSERMARAGFGERRLALPMSRADIASYLGLTVETVSRLFTRFQNMGILKVERRLIHILDLNTLTEISHSMNSLDCNGVIQVRRYGE